MSAAMKAVTFYAWQFSNLYVDRMVKPTPTIAA